MWFKSVVDHPPPGNGTGHHTSGVPNPRNYHLTSQAVPVPTLGRITDYLCPTQGIALGFYVRPTEYHCFLVLKKVISPPIPGGGWSTTDLNHTLRRMKKNFTEKFKISQLLKLYRKIHNRGTVNFGHDFVNIPLKF